MMRSNERARPAVPVPAWAMRAVYRTLAALGGHLDCQGEGKPGGLGHRNRHWLVESVCRSSVPPSLPGVNESNAPNDCVPAVTHNKIQQYLFYKILILPL